MKIIKLAFAACFTLVVIGWAEEKPALTMPDEVTLTSGRVLKRVSVVRWEKDRERVVLKYAGGTEPIAFVLFKKPTPQEIQEIKRDLPEHIWIYKGSAFVVTRGAGSYKLGNMDITVFPGSKKQIDQKGTQHTIVKTDADGKFEFKWKGPEPFVIMANNSRHAGGDVERYFWEIDRDEIADENNVQLSNDNMK